LSIVLYGSGLAREPAVSGPSEIEPIDEATARDGRGARAMRYNTALKLVAGVIALGACAHIAWSQSFPTRPVTFVVPYAVGGTVDFQLRALASATEKHFGRPFVIENRPSANG